jgi:hypothetical protein
MPQARSGGSRRSSASSGSKSSRSTSSGGSGSGASGSSRSGSSRSSGSGSSRSASGGRSTGSRSASSSRSKSTSSRSTSSRASTSKAKAGTTEARFEAAAKRLRTLNERIIEAGKEAGETTLSSYEKALKTIASTLERGPGSSEVEWLSNLATAQAKFIRDMTSSWTSAARKVLK